MLMEYWLEFKDKPLILTKILTENSSNSTEGLLPSPMLTGNGPVRPLAPHIDVDVAILHTSPFKILKTLISMKSSSAYSGNFLPIPPECHHHLDPLSLYSNHSPIMLLPTAMDCSAISTTAKLSSICFTGSDLIILSATILPTRTIIVLLASMLLVATIYFFISSLPGRPSFSVTLSWQQTPWLLNWLLWPEFNIIVFSYIKIKSENNPHNIRNISSIVAQFNCNVVAGTCFFLIWFSWALLKLMFLTFS